MKTHVFTYISMPLKTSDWTCKFYVIKYILMLPASFISSTEFSISSSSYSQIQIWGTLFNQEQGQLNCSKEWTTKM